MREVAATRMARAGSARMVATAARVTTGRSARRMRCAARSSLARPPAAQAAQRAERSRPHVQHARVRAPGLRLSIEDERQAEVVVECVCNSPSAAISNGITPSNAMSSRLRSLRTLPQRAPKILTMSSRRNHVRAAQLFARAGRTATDSPITGVAC